MLLLHAETKETEKLYAQYITKQVVLNNKGEEVTGDVAAFDIDLKKEIGQSKNRQTRINSYFRCLSVIKTASLFTLSLYVEKACGALFGDTLSLEAGYEYCYGASFGHKGETPGLGAEIETEKFQKQFIGKKILDEQGNFVSVKVMKGGATTG